MKDYLIKYKFKSWVTHSSNTQPVTAEEKRKRADEIANLLCNHSVWKSHGHAINRDVAWNICKLKISRSEDD